MIFRKYNRIQNTSRRIQRKLGSFIDPKQKRHTLVVSPELYKKSRDFQIKFLKDMGLLPEDYLLDIGCGTLVGGIPIIRYLEKSHYYGIETRPDVLEEARKELLESKLTQKTPVLLSEDFRETLYQQEYEFVKEITDPVKAAEWWDSLFEESIRKLGSINRKSSTISVKFRMLIFLIANRLYYKKIKKLIIPNKRDR